MEVRSVFLPKTHEATSNTVVWNDQWESLCAQGTFSPEICLNHFLIENKQHGDLSSSLDQYSHMLGTTLHVLQLLGNCGLDALMEEEFETKWEHASVQERRKHVLVGLSGPCGSAKNLNDARIYCGDVLKLEYLSRDPKVFIDLLSQLIPDDVSVVPRTPIFIPNEGWDTFNTRKELSGVTDLEKVTLAEMMILRTKLICQCMISQFKNKYQSHLHQISLSSSLFCLSWEKSFQRSPLRRIKTTLLLNRLRMQDHTKRCWGRFMESRLSSSTPK